MPSTKHCAAAPRRKRSGASKPRRAQREIAQISRRRSRIAIATALIASLLGMMAGWFWWQADNAKARAETMAGNARAGELATTAESIAEAFPDQGVLLALAARRLGQSAETDALLRAARSIFPYATALRGHEGSVSGAQFSPDGTTVVTASADKTARLWRCDVCAPVDDAMVQALRRWVGRPLDNDERLRFGLTDAMPASRSPARIPDRPPASAPPR